ncbi:DUF2171 domain-containing protein [Novosphingobium colocasiae]|uniref:DUF2171 domain-containing protein n=1 Tax=Novosphingobium colocasiae TaxID=1256513 RepID=UPI0035B0373E
MPSTRDAETSWQTAAGTIRKGMKVLTPDGTSIGRVAAVAGNELQLTGGSHAFVLVSQVDGVSDDAVLLERRGDDSFGIAAG